MVYYRWCWDGTKVGSHFLTLDGILPVVLGRHKAVGSHFLTLEGILPVVLGRHKGRLTFPNTGRYITGGARTVQR